MKEPPKDWLTCEFPELADPLQLLAVAKCVDAFGIANNSAIAIKKHKDNVTLIMIVG